MATIAIAMLSGNPTVIPTVALRSEAAWRTGKIEAECVYQEAYDSIKYMHKTRLDPKLAFSATLHVSVQERLEKAKPEYRPVNLPPEPRKYVE